MASFQFADDTEMLATNESGDAKQKFDCIIGIIEEIVISHQFQQTQHDFMEKYYLEFEDTEENKFIYTDIYQKYGEIIEQYLVTELKKHIPNFSMEIFAASLNAHKEEMTNDIFDMFLTFTDFLAFKEMFLDYRAEKEGKHIDLMGSVVVHSIAPTSYSAVTST